MGYLNNSSVTVDAILTTKGRQKLASGAAEGLGVAYFALGDDEVNYDLWNPDNPMGTDYYGIIIENMPVLEASPIPEQNLKSKLVTYTDRNTRKLAVIQAAPPSIGSGLTNPGFTYNASGVLQGITQYKINFTLSPASLSNSSLGYTVSYDSRYFTVLPTVVPTFAGQLANALANNAAISFTGDSSNLSSVITTGEITVIAKTVAPSDFMNTVSLGSTIQQNIYVYGNEVGGRITVPTYVRRLAY